jgi:hypothetical protein
MTHAILEVINGPMDGLNSMLTKSGSVGRNVGSSLTLPLDLEVSGRHCDVVLEGPTWCLRDQKSTNGTWFRCERLAPAQSYPIPEGQLFLVGSTVVQLYKGDQNSNISAITDPGLKDPRESLEMSRELHNVWNKLYSTMPQQGDFCDSSTLLIALLEELFGRKSTTYDSFNQIQSNEKFKILGSWLHTASFKPFYQMVPGALIIAPRVWRIIEIAASNTQTQMTVEDLLKAICQEKRSLAAHYITQDLPLLEAVGFIQARSSSVEHTPKPITPHTTRPISQENYTTTLGKKHIPPSQETNTSDPWCTFGIRIERLVKGFLEDAANPTGREHNSTDQIPALNRDIQEVMSMIAQGGDNQILSEHLELVYNLLIAILTSQKESNAIFAKALAQRIGKTITMPQKNNGKVLTMGKSKIEASDVVNGIRGALAKAESSGLSDKIVRGVLMEKVTKFSIGG